MYCMNVHNDAKIVIHLICDINFIAEYLALRSFQFFIQKKQIYVSLKSQWLTIVRFPSHANTFHVFNSSPPSAKHQRQKVTTFPAMKARLEASRHGKLHEIIKCIPNRKRECDREKYYAVKRKDVIKLN